LGTNFASQLRVDDHEAAIVQPLAGGEESARNKRDLHGLEIAGICRAENSGVALFRRLWWVLRNEKVLSRLSHRLELRW
jgi:hypothetical protein